ncbi:hypothetical protein FOZ63_000191 [Perkinsus olseni]|uniref:Uncharacterized protein n=1 Tax=Perkinsus olseni TaxID=32597 RepID=A0A7J6UPK3_PEROL|nr:hypothetical protein FOZ63_000191 [Perkinsus olseni]
MATLLRPSAGLLRSRLYAMDARRYIPTTPGRTCGFARPTRRIMKSPEVHPNIKPKLSEYRISVMANGQVTMVRPYPKKLNKSLPDEKMDKHTKRFGYRGEDVMRWRNVEYKWEYKSSYKPNRHSLWAGSMERIVRDPVTKKVAKEKIPLDLRWS